MFRSICLFFPHQFALAPTLFCRPLELISSNVPTVLSNTRWIKKEKHCLSVSGSFVIVFGWFCGTGCRFGSLLVLWHDKDCETNDRMGWVSMGQKGPAFACGSHSRFLYVAILLKLDWPFVPGPDCWWLSVPTLSV